MRGRKTGGRKKGTPNRRTIAQREIIASGMTPVEFLCSVYRDPKQSMTRRIEAAKGAAPYMHARFTPTSYTPPQDQLEQDNTINLVFVDPARGCGAMNASPPIGSAANGVDGMTR